MLDPELENHGAVSVGQTAGAAAVKGIDGDVVGGDLCAGRRVDRSRTSIERRVGSDGARSGHQRDSAAGDRASLSGCLAKRPIRGQQRERAQSGGR